MLVAFLVAGGVTYRMLDRGLARQLDAAVNETYSVVASTYAQNDVEDLIAAVNTYSSLRSADRSLFALVDPAGKRLAGNFTPPALAYGLSTIEPGTLGIEDKSAYRIRAGTVGGNRLIVGQSFADVEGLSRIELISLGWASLFVVAIAIGGGAFLAAGAQSRLDAVAKTMFDVSNGQLDKRIPLTGNGDDIEVVSGQINQALDRLAALVEGMRQVSSDIAHELKTPLNRLKMILNEAVDNDDRGEDVGSLLSDASAESDQINGTFDALLRISQIEAGARKTRFRMIDLNEIVTFLAEVYVDVASDAGHKLELTALGDRAIVMGDRELLTQMLANLVENAIRHCRSGSEIQIALRRETDKIVLSVSDNGPGIPVEERDKVFRRLYRLDKSRTTPGSGLGLSLVRAIADLHSAEILLADNQPGVRISVAIPAYG
jgi:signal transduction histidine kinase